MEVYGLPQTKTTLHFNTSYDLYHGMVKAVAKIPVRNSEAAF